jgi:hypothetical protein
VFKPDNFNRLQFVRFLKQHNLKLKEQKLQIRAAEWKHMRNDNKVKDKSEWTDQAHFMKFHERCGGLKTVVLIRAKNGKIFGGYNDVPWHKGGKVSTGRRDKR